MVDSAEEESGGEPGSSVSDAEIAARLACMKSHASAPPMSPTKQALCHSLCTAFPTVDPAVVRVKIPCQTWCLDVFLASKLGKLHFWSSLIILEYGPVSLTRRACRASPVAAKV